jgi:lactobin A/cerein 7B family class IIb bacteriocin
MKKDNLNKLSLLAEELKDDAKMEEYRKSPMPFLQKYDIDPSEMELSEDQLEQIAGGWIPIAVKLIVTAGGIATTYIHNDDRQGEGGGKDKGDKFRPK